MQFVGVADQRPGFVGDLGDCRGIELRQVLHLVDRQRAPRGHGPRAALFQRGVVEERVRIGVEQLVAERRRLARLDGTSSTRPDLMSSEQRQPAVDVHRLVQAVVHRLLHQRMIGNLDVAVMVLQAADGFGKGGGQQIVAAELLQERRHASCRPCCRSTARARVTFHRQRTLEHGHGQQGLLQQVAGRSADVSIPNRLSIGKLCCGPSESTMPSSSAAACSSKSKLRQNRLRRARPQALLIRAPSGAWITSCMPPDSSKNRSKTISLAGGHQPTAACWAAT